MKKPAKPKPRRRPRKAQSPAVIAAGSARPQLLPEISLAAFSSASPASRTKQKPKRRGQAARSARRAAAQQTVMRLAPPVHGVSTASAASRAAVLSQDDRSALALLLAPFLILAVALGANHHWRIAVPSIPSSVPPLAATAPHTPSHPGRIAGLDTRPVRPLTPPPVVGLGSPTPLYPRHAPVVDAPPAISVPGRLPYPMAPPPIEVAAIDLGRPSPALPTRPPEILPPPEIAAPLAGLAYPAAPPVIASPPAITLATPLPAYPQRAPDFVAAPLRIPAPPGALAYPSAAPAVDVASLDPGPASARPLPPVPPAATAPSSDSGLCRPTTARLASFSSIGRRARAQLKPPPPSPDPQAFGHALAQAALAQTTGLVVYSARYQAMAYPMGDVLALHGSCSDLVVRAYRAVGVDLQQLVRQSGVGSGDTNIDHRRTATLRRLFARLGASLPVSEFPESYKPGDVVTFHRPFGRVSNAHIAIVSDVLAPSGRPMIVHNRGYGPQLEDALFADPITGHYRFDGRHSASEEARQEPEVTRKVWRTSYRR